MARLIEEPQRETPTEPRSPADRGDRLALVAFGVVVVVALVLFLVLGRHRWFFGDEWDFLVERRAGNITDLLRPHYEHWSTLPILAYRALYGVFGLRTYVPYQLTSILLHLTAAVLLLLVMRRSGVRPWIATAAASLFALFGTGSEDIVWAFQMAWSAALVFGLIHLLLADHDGPVDRRDWLGLAAGLASLMCSGVGVTMAIAVGVAVLIRRGWRLALFHTLPLGAVYVLWWLAEARNSYGNANAEISKVAEWTWTGIEATFDGLGQVTGVGIALGILLVVGLALACWHWDRAELRRRGAAPAGLLVGTLAFFVISGVGRASAWGDPAFARSSRYLHVAAALTLPALAVAADALVRQWRVAVPVVAALLVIGIPGNIEALSEHPAVDHRVPGWVFVYRSITQSDDHVSRTDCRTIDLRFRRHLDAGQSLVITGGPVRINDADRGGHIFGLFGDYRVYYPDDGNTLRARKPIDLLLDRDDPGSPVTVCGPV